MHRAKLPELVIVGGVSTAEQHRILSELASRMKDGETLPIGGRDPSVLEGVDVRYLVVRDTDTEHFAVASRLQTGFQALRSSGPTARTGSRRNPGMRFRNASSGCSVARQAALACDSDVRAHAR